MSDEANGTGGPEPAERPPSAPAGAARTRGQAKGSAPGAATARPRLRELLTDTGPVWHCWEAGITIEAIDTGGAPPEVLVFLAGADSRGYRVRGNTREVAQQLGLDW